MERETRSKSKKRIHQEVIAAQPQGYVEIRNVVQLRRWVAICSRNIIVRASIEILDVKIPVDDEVLPLLRQLLSNVLRFHTLRLHYPCNTVRWMPSPYRHFNKLSLLDTTLPHRVLARFIEDHAGIVDLVLGPCGTSSSCPLAGTPLPQLEHLSCSPACLPHLITLDSTSIWHLDVTFSSRRDRKPTSESMFQAISLLPNLRRLHIDFDSTDLPFVENLAQAAPYVRYLKLTESTIFPIDPSFAGYTVFRDVAGWTAKLDAFQNLTHLWVKISGTFVLPWTVDNEDNTVRRWLTTHTGISRHPTLSRLSLWTKARSKKGSISVWERQRKKWVKVYHKFVAESAAEEIDAGAFND